jgi:ubiquinone biosynthesis protein
MVQVLGVLIILLAVVVLRRVIGIQHGRWVTTIIAVVVAEFAVVQVLRLVYGSVAATPTSAVLGAWALVTIFAIFGVLLVELLSRRRRGRSRSWVPHPIRGVQSWIRRIVRYAQVGVIFVHRGLVHPGTDADIADSRLGRALRRSFEDAGGLFVKLGQAMAQQPQIVTPAVADQLAPLQLAAAPADLEAARAVITLDLGPPEEVFANFAPTPLGSASIAQTYLASLRDGREVVVKVQRPGVADAIERDLDILRRLADRFDRTTTWAPTLGLKELVAGFDERTREELDFRIEAANETTAARSVDQTGPLAIPLVIDGLTTKRVLVEERAPGQSVGSQEAFAGWAADARRSIADGLFSYMLRQMLSGEPFHADPHPGNVFLRPDGRLELIDFGAVGRLDPYERAAFVDLLQGVEQQDPAVVREGLLRIGIPQGKIDEEALDRELGRLLSKGLQADGRINPQMFEDLLFVLRDFRILLPRSTTTLLRTFVTLLGTLEVIDPGYRVTEAAQRLSEELVGPAELPHDIQSLLADQAAKNSNIIERLPREIDALVRTLTRGDFQTHLRLLSNDDDVVVVRSLVNRGVMAVVASALSLVSAMMLASGSAPSVHGVQIVNLLGAVGLFFGILLLLRLVIQVVRDGG